MNLRQLAAYAVLAIAFSGCASQGATQTDAVAGETVVAAAHTVQAATPADPQVALPEANAQPSALAPEIQTPSSAAAPATSADQAEADFEALYGATGDDNAAGGNAVSQFRDPWEKYNRKVHEFNNVIDRAILRPVAQAYVRVVPKPIRLGISNFFRNLGQPVTMINALLQGKPEVAANAAMRFAVNSTFGLGGLLDPASAIDIPTEQEDFGQTLGKWGWAKSRYVELPLFGPRTVRDIFGMVVDRPLNPTRHFDTESQTGMSVIQVIDIRTQLLSIDSLREGAADDYLLYRDSWMQRRNYQIFGENEAGGEGVPAYLLTAPVPMAPMPNSDEKPKKRSRWKFWQKKSK